MRSVYMRVYVLPGECTHILVCVMCAHAGAFVQLVFTVYVCMRVCLCVFIHVCMFQSCWMHSEGVARLYNKVEILHSPSPEFHNIVPSIF